MNLFVLQLYVIVTLRVLCIILNSLIFIRCSWIWTASDFDPLKNDVRRRHKDRHEGFLPGVDFVNACLNHKAFLILRIFVPSKLSALAPFHSPNFSQFLLCPESQTENSSPPIPAAHQLSLTTLRTLLPHTTPHLFLLNSPTPASLHTRLCLWFGFDKVVVNKKLTQLLGSITLLTQSQLC